MAPDKSALHKNMFKDNASGSLNSGDGIEMSRPSITVGR